MCDTNKEGTYFILDDDSNEISISEERMENMILNIVENFKNKNEIDEEELKKTVVNEVEKLLETTIEEAQTI